MVAVDSMLVGFVEVIIEVPVVAVANLEADIVEVVIVEAVVVISTSCMKILQYYSEGRGVIKLVLHFLCYNKGELIYCPYPICTVPLTHILGCLDNSHPLRILFVKMYAIIHMQFLKREILIVSVYMHYGICVPIHRLPG